MLPAGTQLMVDGENADPLLLDDSERLTAIAKDVARRIGAVVVDSFAHRFEPQGVSVVLILAESHLSIHTFPEHAAYLADVFTCGDVNPSPAANFLRDALGGRISVRLVGRGPRRKL